MMLDAVLTLLLMIKMQSDDDSLKLSSKSSEIIIYNISEYLTERNIDKIKQTRKIKKKKIKKKIKKSLSCNNIIEPSNRFIEIPINISQSVSNLAKIKMTTSTLEQECSLTPSISSCFFYDESIYDSFNRNNSAKNDSTDTMKKKKNFFKKIFQKLKNKDSKKNHDNEKINQLSSIENDCKYNEPIFLQDIIQQKTYNSNSYIISSAESNNQSISNDANQRNSITTKLTITDELNRTQLVAESSPDVAIESFNESLNKSYKSLQSIHEVMVGNMMQLFNREKELNNLEERSNELERTSSFLQLTTTQVKKAQKRTRAWVAIIVSIIAVILIVTITILILTYNKKSFNESKPTPSQTNSNFKT